MLHSQKADILMLDFEEILAIKYWNKIIT